MKFIHLTDTHVIGKGLLYGQDPAARLRAAVTSINTEHSDAAFVVLTGDMTLGVILLPTLGFQRKSRN